MSDSSIPRTRLPDAREFPRFAGVPTFCRFPLIDDVDPAHQPVDWAVYGIPFDGGVTYRPGARFGPRAIREASAYVKPYHLEHDINIAETLSLADAGDSPVRPYSCEDTADVAGQHAESIGDPSHTRLLAVGGDHSIAYANLHATWRRMGRPEKGLAMLHFDAHLDTAGPIWGHTWTHASPFRLGIEHGLIDPQRFFSIGIRGPLNTADDLAYGREHGIEIATVEDIRLRDGRERLRAFLSRLDNAPVYLTFDIDCVDPSAAPGTGTPCCGGLHAGEVFELLRACAGMNLCGADVVEVLPDRDPAGVTALLASHVIFEILALAAMHRRATG